MKIKTGGGASALSFAIDNLTDEEPPFTQQQYSYDPFIGNALGRTYKIGLRKQF